jgi:putative ABC transport system permease protein
VFALALSSIRRRPGRLAATLLSAFLGAVIIMAFNSMHDTAAGEGVDDVSAESLTTAAGVVGGYGTLLVFFAVASTLTVNVRQRQEEITLLRCSGATPGQIKWLVVGEAAVVALVASALAVGPAMLGAQALLDAFQDSGQVAKDVDHAFGPIALGSGIGVTLLASAGAAFLAVRRAARAAAGTRREPRGRLRNVAAWAALLIGAVSVGSTFAMDEEEPAAMAPPAYGAILLSVGFALLAPAVLHALLGRLERPITALTGASGYLAVHNMRRRAAQLSGVLVPLIVFTGMATATLYMDAINSDAAKASGVIMSVEDKNLETLNFVVVGIIVVFCCIMLINSLYAATSYRRREFGQQRLAGATAGQVRAMVGLEGLVLTATGVFFGTVAGNAGILAFSALRSDSLPDQGPGIWLAVVAVGAAATLLTSLGTAHRMLRGPAVNAVGPAT